VATWQRECVYERKLRHIVELVVQLPPGANRNFFTDML
jgi:hypothetical protein